MKKLHVLLPLLIAPLLLMSCATALQMTDHAQKYEPRAYATSAAMDFLGFKADNNMLSQNDYDMWQLVWDNRTLRQLGSELQACNIADDQSHAYFGLYTLQEIKEFKSDKRYLTFVEVSEHSITYLDKPAGSLVGQILGGVAAGIGAGVVVFAPGAGIACILGGGTVALLSSIGSGKSTLAAKGTYNIYVYDRQEEKIVHRVTATVNEAKEYKGNYAKLDDDGRREVLDYYGAVIANAILQKYDEVQSWINAR